MQLYIDPCCQYGDSCRIISPALVPSAAVFSNRCRVDYQIPDAAVGIFNSYPRILGREQFAIFIPSNTGRRSTVESASQVQRVALTTARHVVELDVRQWSWRNYKYDTIDQWSTER